MPGAPLLSAAVRVDPITRTAQRAPRSSGGRSAPPPATRHPPPVTRHPPPVTRHRPPPPTGAAPAFTLPAGRGEKYG
ncbi:hypothetical protein ACN24K_10615 [Streptomyces microflavus]